ncbi:hypothetical protein BsWGS_24794 [Bradybaena similaris]
MYTNCTYVSGSLEIVFLEDPNVDYDLSFLSQIKEVTGYVLISGNFVDHIPLTSLRIIRGNPLFYHNKTNSWYSLFVALNYERHGSRGLTELRFTSLSEILAGKVFFQNNDRLCFEESIRWQDINPKSDPPVVFVSDSKEPKRQCGQCHESCYNPVTKLRHCWGEGPHMCQKLSYGEVCHGNCGGSRCYGSAPNQCCHPQCAGGCTGPLKTDCFACLNYIDEGECVAFCPKESIYDKIKMVNTPNENMKYTFGSVCVRQCPDFLLQDGNSCVRQCAENYHAMDQKHCKPCNGPCPKSCPGMDSPNFLNKNNIKDFDGCTSINGNLIILINSFLRDEHYNIEPLHPHNLTVLKNVKEITGYLYIQSNHSEFTDLSFLSSLEVIHGRTYADSMMTTLNIFQTPLRSLDLISLKHIRNGNVFIALNNHLCYADMLDWKTVLTHTEQKVTIYGNRKKDQCVREGEVCDSQCGVSGCWGKGPNKCLKCANYVYEEESLCLNKCTDMERLYHEGNGKCRLCHKECANTCNGTKNTDCDKCAHVTMRNTMGVDTCEESCGEGMYHDENSICRPCHANCGQNGCTGPEKIVGQNGCKVCDIGIRESSDGIIECLPVDAVCQDGYHNSLSPRSKFARSFPVCEKCHEYCISCFGPATQFCTKCKYFKDGKFCVKDCPNFKYGDPVTQLCEQCDPQCRTGCFGPTSADCIACANFKIYTDVENKTFNCTPECPAHLPFLVKEIETDENRVVCADGTHPEVHASRVKDAEEEKHKLSIILGVTVPLTIILVIMAFVVAYFCHKRAQNNMKAAEYTAKITGFEEIEPLTPTNAKPDLAQMRIISEEELRRGAIIGSGAFGTVYKGIWIPQGENVKIPVAIKVLQEGTSPSQSTELLEEARVMCSVDNICCVRILGVCMKSQMMLVTQLMPHGNLLNYVRANAQHIGSKALLNWCTQIARGMAYLEERGIVHRDLAARNVLVQTPNQVKITDFGLAKLLDSDSLEYHSSGGLMPIKWLALECILHRIFTHKSDVWSYGITIWELFTLGKKPYDGVRTKDVPILLEKGERLQQPIICTIDVYMIMVKCWMLDADSRPSFKELQEEFAKMSRDPGRYLVIEGDALMRLPSVSYDKNELVHGISGDGSESVMEAEEYLCPVEHQRQQRPNSALWTYDRQLSPNFANQAPDLNNINSPDGTKGNIYGRDGQKIREKKYGHLTAAARAKQERESPHDSINSRYSSDPIKFSRDREEIEWGQGEIPVFNGGIYPEYPRAVRSSKIPILPVDEEDYLRPGAAAAAAQSLAYLDLDGTGYYQNEKEAFPEDDDDPFSNEVDHMLDQLSEAPTGSLPSTNSSINPHSTYPDKRVVIPVAVANPDYFEDGSEIWKQKMSKNNGYISVPNTSPVHQITKNGLGPNYRKINNFISPNSSQTVNSRINFPGVQSNRYEAKV